jgi:tape measure domain-containing protein
VATGGNTEDLNGALRATAQVFSKGKVTAEELRGQIGERLPGAFTIFAQATGRSTQQLDEDLQKGKVNLNDFVKFANELFKRYGSTAEILAKAPENAGARLEVALQAATYEYLGMFQVVGAAFQSYAADLVNFVTQNKSAIATTIAEFVVFAKDLYSIFESLVQALFPVFKSLFTFMFSNFAKGLDALATLAEETRRAAGGPEQRAQKQVETLYPNPIDRALYGAQAYREALQVELQYEKGAPGRRKTRNQRVADMEKVLFPQFTPDQFGKGLGTGKIAGGLDSQGKDAAGKRKNYVSQLAKIYQEELQNRLLYIDQDASLSDREREIKKAAESFRYENLIAEAEHTEKTSAEKTKNIANLSEYLKESKRLYDLEKAQIQARYEGVVTKPLRDMLGEDRSAQIELQASIASLASGKDELTQVERRQMQIKQALLGLDKTQIDGMKPLIDLILEEAKKVDILTEAQKRANRVKEERNRLEANLAAARSRVSVAGGGLMAGFYGNAAQTYEQALTESKGNKEYARQMAELETQAMKLESVFGGIQNAIGGVGDAFASMMTEGVVAMIEGTATAQEVFSRFLKAIGDALLQAAAQMIATYIAIGIAKAFAGMGSGGGFNANATNATDAGLLNPSTMYSAFEFAKEGAYWTGGFQAFADGGMVTGPTLGLIGEGGEPEYVIPQSKMRGAMERYSSGARGASVIPSMADGNASGDALAGMMGPIDVRYQVERINSVDYVTNDQFQTGMRQAALQGAVQGEQRTLRRLQMSTSTRKRVGL